MATSTDPLQRDQIGVVSHDTGARYEAPSTNSALELARSLAGIQPALQETLGNIAQQGQADAAAKAKAAALETSGAPLADAVRLGQIKATQNPWFVDAYNREAGAIRGQDALSKLQTDSASWAEKNDPVAFATKWRSSVGDLTKQFDGDPETIKGFAAAEGQATQQVLATNQAFNSKRIEDERYQNLGALAADAVQRAVQGNGGHASGSQIAAALAPAKAQWIATGGSLDDWNKLAITAVTTASYSIRSPGLLDALKDPALLNGPRENDTSQYGDGVDAETPSLPTPLKPPSVMGYPTVQNPDTSTWDKRADGSAKGMGFLGLLQRPDGGVSSEISVGVEIKGKETEIPLMVPGLTKPELDYLMTHDPSAASFQRDMPRSILQKAEAHAQERMASGLSPFRQDNEPIAQALQHDAPQGAPAAVSGQKLQPPAMGRITNTFAQHLARGSAGVDIAVPIGTKLTTPIAGTAEVGYQKGKAGLYVKIVSPDGKVQQVLAHLAVASVENGQQVPAGAIIGRSGQSGDATGPHVHWQLKVDGQQVDPLAYHAQQGEADQAHQAAVAAGEQAPALAPPQNPQVATQPQTSPLGPSLYDMPGVADAAESDRYRIRASVNSEATDRLQQMTAERKLQGQEATDRLYATFGTKLLMGDVSTGTIVQTLSKGGYAAPVIAEALNNLHSAVSDTAGLATARLTIQGTDPAQGKKVFDLATEGRVNGYTPEYEQKVANAITAGDISADDGTQMVGAAVSRTESLKSQARADANFEAAHPAQAGAIIKKAGDLNKGVDAYTAQAVTAGQSIVGKVITGPQSNYLKSKIKQTVLSWLAYHPGDYAGAEQAARDQTAAFLKSLLAQKGHATPSSSPQPAAGGNPRR